MTFRAREAVLSYWQKMVGMATGMSVIVGVLVSVNQMGKLVDDSKRANVTNRLQALQQVYRFLERDEAVRQRARAFLREGLPKIKPRMAALIREAGSGEDFYLSETMKDYAAVHYHYEQLGALVKLGYVEFPLVYEVIPFPDDYMHEIEPLRQALAANWKGMGRPLPDLGENIGYLKRCYDFSRQTGGGVARCPD